MNGSVFGEIPDLLEGGISGFITPKGGGSGSTVVVSPEIIPDGTLICTITVDSTPYYIYAPTPEDVNVTQILGSGTKIAQITIGNQTTDIYAPTPIIPDAVVVTPTLQSGVKIGSITVGSVTTDLYAPDAGTPTIIPCYAYFDFNDYGNYFNTYIPQRANWEYYLDFEIAAYQNDKAIIGSSGGGNNRLSLTMYNSKWYCSNGNGEINFGDIDSVVGRHHIVINRKNDNKIVFDDVVVGDFAQIDSNINLRLNARADNMFCNNSKVYRFKVINKSNDDVIADFQPCKILLGNQVVNSGIIDVSGHWCGNGYTRLVEIS